MSIYLYILGQMLYMEEWKMIVFLGTPQMNDLDAILNTHMESTKEHAHESWENEPTRAVARFMFSARFRPERKQAKIFAAFLLCTFISLKRTFFCYENKSDNEG